MTEPGKSAPPTPLVPPGPRPAGSGSRTARRRARIRTGLGPYLRDNAGVIAAFVATRALVLAALYATWWLGPPPPLEGGGGPWAPPLLKLESWDVRWYRDIALEGYGTGSRHELMRFAFFPLWPMVLRAGVETVRVAGALVMGAVLPNLLALAAVLRLRGLLVRAGEDGALATRACVYLLLFPASFTLSMGYAESLFLLLSVLYAETLIARDTASPAGAAWGFLAGLTRPQGVLASVIALPSLMRGSLRSRIAPALVAAGPPLGLAAFLGYAWAVAGNPLLPFELQSVPEWDKQFVAFPLSVYDKLAGDQGLGLTPDRLRAVLVLFGLGVLAATFRKLPAGLVAYAVVSLVLGSSTRIFTGVDRYVLIAFPVFWGLAHVGRNKIADLTYRTVAPGLLALAAIVSFREAGAPFPWIP